MSQCSIILQMLQRGEKITPLTAFRRCGTLALHSRCAELRERGYKIKCVVVRHRGRRFGVYWLAGLN